MQLPKHRPRSDFEALLHSREQSRASELSRVKRPSTGGQFLLVDTAQARTSVAREEKGRENKLPKAKGDSREKVRKNVSGLSRRESKSEASHE